jgi:hypothetical protein
LQVEQVDDALALGVKQAALNFNLSQLITPHGETNGPVWLTDGPRYFLHRAYLETVDRQIKALSEMCFAAARRRDSTRDACAPQTD